MSRRWHVVKLGGSLLALDDLPGRWRRFAQQWRDDRLLLVVGGGSTADLVRRWDVLYQLDASRSHWLALRAMQLNSHLVAAILEGTEVVVDAAGGETAWQAARQPIVDPLGWLDQRWRHGQTTPTDWSFTSDSIAAQIAADLRAARLTLLKSTDWLGGDDWQAAAARGVVDGRFASVAAAAGEISIVNLRSERFRND